MNRALLVAVAALALCALALLCSLTGGLVGYGIVVARATAVAVVPVTATPRPAPTEALPDQPRPTPTEAPLPSATAVAVGSTANVAETLAAIESEELPQRDLFALAQRYGTLPEGATRTVRESDPGYQIGDRLEFFVSGEDDGAFVATAILRAQSEHASWWVEEGWEVDQGDLEASVRLFEEQSYPTNRAAFGSEWSPGVDGDVRVHIFLGNVPGVGGYYSSADQFPRSVIETSNEKEIFYINLDNALPGTSYFDGILAHEFQHMIHWNEDRNEEIWINEGLSELAAHINGFDVDSAARSFTSHPDIPTTRWAEQSYPYYGSAFLFLLYFQERFGAEAVRELVSEPLDGPAAFDALLARRGGPSFDELFADWMVALLLDDPAVGEGQFAIEGEDAGRLDEAAGTRAYPVSEGGSVQQYGVDRLDFEAPGGGAAGTLTLTFDGADHSVLLPEPPRSGEWALWGNRGDDSHASVARPFDLTGLSEATLTFWAWYELESDYDYAYVTVSADGGATWTPLPTEDTTERDPYGNSFGHAFTGASGGWRQQRVDLSPYAGGQVLVAFEVVTDDALNEPGFVVDDIELPALGYREDFEGGHGGWETAGFVRVGSALPQRWIVRAVATGPAGTQIYSVPLDEQGAGTIDFVEFGVGVERVTLLVSAVTHAATRPGDYRYEASLSR